MITKLLIASCLVATTVIIHATGLGMMLSHVMHSTARPDTGFWPIAWLLIRIAWFLIVLHLLEIAVWALFFWWHKCLPDVESSFYFSGVTYATIGYGDFGTAKRMATVRASRGIDWHSDVRPLDGVLLRYREQKYSSTHGR